MLYILMFIHIILGKTAEILDELNEINKANRAPRMSPLIFCLALVLRYEDGSRCREWAFRLLPQICRIPTHLFEFISHYMTCTPERKPLGIVYTH